MKILLDSDCLFALFSTSDIHHKKAKKLLEKYLKNSLFYVTNLVVQETATVISYRFGQKTALEFLTKFRKLPVSIIRLDDKLEKKVWDVFKKQTKKGTSFIDCSNLVVFEFYQLDKIFSFDKFYQQNLKLD